MKSFTTKEALRIIMASAKTYKKLLENKNFIFVYRNRVNNQIEFFETVFLARHFQHLCGVDYIDMDTGNVIRNATDFYNNYCLGFTLDKRYYMPSSCLLEDIRKLGNSPSQVLAVLSKESVSKEKVYRKICYVAKGVPLRKLELPNNLQTLIDLKDYTQ